MKIIKDQVAVITGAASGIGRALAFQAAKEGMRLVLADIEIAALEQTTQELADQGAEVLPVPTDVSQPEQVQALALQALHTYGAVHLLCNNAGVSGGSSIWETAPEEWQWILSVNLWGVINGVHTFTPLMLEQDEPCHILNTASIAGLISGPDLGAYKVSKHAVVSFSETMYHELKEAKSKIGISVLCPGWVQTNISDSDRNRPPELAPSPEDAPRSPKYEKLDESLRRVIAKGKSPESIAEQVFQAIRSDQFYILTHPDMKPLVDSRLEDLRQERNPSNPL